MFALPRLVVAGNFYINKSKILIISIQDSACYEIVILLSFKSYRKLEHLLPYGGFKAHYFEIITYFNYVLVLNPVGVLVIKL